MKLERGQGAKMIHGVMKIVREGVQGLTKDDVLHALGLERHVERVPKLLVLGIGVALGAALGLMLTPSGVPKVAREKVSSAPRAARKAASKAKRRLRNGAAHPPSRVERSA